MTLELTTINPRAIYVQDTEPTDLTQGKLWYNTLTNVLYSSDGSNYIQVIASDIEQLNQMITENSLSILEIQASDTITSDTSGFMVRDVFSDSGGYLNTIDTTNTTALYVSTNEYINAGEVTRNETTDTGYVTQAETSYQGIALIGYENCAVKSITKSASSTATNVYVLNASFTQLGTATYSGNTATFSAPVSLTGSGTEVYYIVNWKNGGYTNAYKSLAHPINLTEIRTTGRCWMTALNGTGLDVTQTGYTSEIVSLVLLSANARADAIIQTSAQTINSGATKFQIFSYKNTLDGTGTIDADISFDNGSHYQTGIELNTETNIVNTGTQMILKLNLNAGASDGTAESSGYGVIYW